MAASTKTTVAKKAPVAKKPKSHPSYAEMVKEAIFALKERTGSSQYAIAKHIEDHQKDLPPNFKKMLLVQLKKLVAAGKLVKVKNSFKLGTGAAEKPEKPVAEKPKKALAEKKKAPATAAAKKAPAAVKKSAKKVKTPVKAKKPVKKTVTAKKPKSIKSPAKKVAPKKKAAVKK
ncbi:histone H1.2-like [Rutidosis leptorrhynchoides]|uniref:histone H1.2-like n=1 Tax=Rutidosis leptorrhynchoides TaxID=125765 RepID=UPI003A98F287